MSADELSTSSSSHSGEHDGTIGLQEEIDDNAGQVHNLAPPGHGIEPANSVSTYATSSTPNTQNPIYQAAANDHKDFTVHDTVETEMVIDEERTATGEVLVHTDSDSSSESE